VVIQARQEIGEEQKAKSGKLFPKSIEEVLKRNKNVLSKILLQALPPRRAMDHKIKVIPRFELPSKALYWLNQVELLELKK
jgi:hypothetical protein